MRNYPLDTNAIKANTIATVSVDPVVDFNTGEQKRDKDGIPKWRLEILVREPGATRSEVDHINFAAHEPPTATTPDEMVLTGLVGRPWSNENDYGHSSGVAMSAKSVRFQPTQHTNGNGAQGKQAERAVA